jgi:hypothetical protein
MEDFRGGALQGGGAIQFGDGGGTKITPDPVPAYLKLKEGGVGFPTRQGDKLTVILPVGGPDAWLLTACENEHFGNREPTVVRWVSITKKKVQQEMLLPAGEIVLDYHPNSRFLLTTTKAERGNFNKQDQPLTLWRVMPNDEQITPVVRWNGGTEDRFGGTDGWGRVINNRIVLQRRKKQEYVGWDVVDKKIAYIIEQQSFFAPELVLSGGRNQAYLPEDKQVRIFDTLTGETLATIASPEGTASVAVSEDGGRLAVLNRNSLSVWNLDDLRQQPEVFQAEAIGSPFARKMAWLDDQRIMVEDSNDLILFSLKHNMAIWNYKFDHGAVRDWSATRLRHIANGHLVYGASYREGRETGLAVGNVKLPGPKVDSVSDDIRLDDLRVLHPGSKVRLEVRCGEHNAQVYEALVQKIEGNGWVLEQDNPADATMFADMTRGENQTVEYRKFGFGGGGTETVSVTPYVSSLNIQASGEVATADPAR